MLLQGEQFYIFRGNYWDNQNYISQSILINDYNFSEILEIKKYFNEYNLYNQSSYLNLGTGAIHHRPLVSLILAFFFKFKILSYFFLNNLFKIYIISLIFLSFYFFLSKLIYKNIYFVTLVFTFSFWIIYIFEQEALSHLFSIPFFILCISYLLMLKKKIFLKNTNDNYLFLIFNITLFSIYPELFSIFFLIVFFFLFFRVNLNNFFYTNYKFIIKFVIIFIAFTAPTFSLTYLALVNQIKGNLLNYWWGYYGAFILGNDNSFFNSANINFIKSIFNDNYNFYYNLIKIKDLLFQSGLNLFFLNIIPSFSGMYYLSVSKINNIFDYVVCIFIVLLNLYLIKNFIINIYYIFLKKNLNVNILLKSCILIFLILFLFFLFKKSYWAIIKLYFYLSPILFIFIVFNLRDGKKNIISINIVALLLIIFFPFYKYSIFNNGIGRYDTFPSIIDPFYKKQINWIIDNKKFIYCDEIIINNSDYIVVNYLSIKLKYLDYKFENEIYKKNIPIMKNHRLCNIRLINSNFIIYD
jgi:hypothetical protein